MVRTWEFAAGEPQMNVVGEVAVAVTPLEAVCEVHGTRHRESGHDILAFSRLHGAWMVVWRTMQITTEGKSAGSRCRMTTACRFRR